MTNQELKNELEEKLIQIYPLFKKESYQNISTEDIIDSLNEVSQQLQFMTGKLMLQDLPNDVPREDAITMSIVLWKHMGKRLSEELQKLK
jgi:Ca2+-binding EF-hand superfamily protein